MNNFWNVDLDELVKRLNLMANQLSSIRLRNEGLQYMAIAWKGVGHGGIFFLDGIGVQFYEIGTFRFYRQP